MVILLCTVLQGCGSVVSVSRSAGALSCRSTGESSIPELLLGLLYNSTTGRLSAEVIKGSHFKNSASDKLPSKTSTCKIFLQANIFHACAVVMFSFLFLCSACIWTTLFLSFTLFSVIFLFRCPVVGLFCCVKHFISGQLYIMRGKFIVMPKGQNHPYNRVFFFTLLPQCPLHFTSIV